MIEKFKIAIIGAGITGICLAYGLSKHSYLDVFCYKANATIKENGVVIGIGSNSQEALRLISIELQEALEKAS
jgi:2-polyprenyl-6-methoxyphenol hydroxylase-like FAD-dependent oxidoreductase